MQRGLYLQIMLVTAWQQRVDIENRAKASDSSRVYVQYRGHLFSATGSTWMPSTA